MSSNKPENLRKIATYALGLTVESAATRRIVKTSFANGSWSETSLEFDRAGVDSYLGRELTTRATNGQQLTVEVIFNQSGAVGRILTPPQQNDSWHPVLVTSMSYANPFSKKDDIDPIPELASGTLADEPETAIQYGSDVLVWRPAGTGGDSITVAIGQEGLLRQVTYRDECISITRTFESFDQTFGLYLPDEAAIDSTASFEQILASVHTLGHAKEMHVKNFDTFEL